MMSTLTRNWLTAFAALGVALAPASATTAERNGVPSRVAPALNVVTSTTDLYDIARTVGGSRVSVVHISEGYQDPHFVDPKPSFILQLRKADVFAFVGLDLEIGWMNLLLDGAKNARIRQGGQGYLDVSQAIPVLDVARGNVDRSQGDVHPRGNPHYWLDPENGRRIARLFRDKFVQLDPAGKAQYDRGLADFTAALNAAERAWAPLVAQIKGKPVVAYHTSWRYFAEYTGMNIVGFMEPKPGVPPSPSHLLGLVRTMRQTGAKLIIMEPFYNRRTVDVIARQTGATVLVIPPSVGGVKGLDSYVQVMRHAITQVANALR
jgi:zinc/manganese transport system substrate-binding protein